MCKRTPPYFLYGEKTLKLVIASNNAHKVEEIKAILAPYFDEILSLKEANLAIDVVEDGENL